MTVFTILIVLLTVVISCKSYPEEIEPNDLRVNATRVIMDQSKVVYGKILSGNDKDYFLIEDFPSISDSFTMNIVVSGVKGFDMRLSVFYNDEMKPFKTSNDFMIGDGESLTSIGVKYGDKLILLVDSVPTNLDNIDLGRLEKDDPDYPFVDNKNYKISIELLPAKDMETEPNDTFDTADRIVIGRPVTGHFTPFIENDYESKVIDPLGDYNLYERVE